ncbi:MAG: lipopolysaccharide kinase InaA family protein [Akkermansiaceae bacterium]|jgi:tRNA A-37 threonylcarbamoyl transferase component Bud32|nr:lipopolysaccharide kinase InaA family protein [Akkermansiaceae bacterium]
MKFIAIAPDLSSDSVAAIQAAVSTLPEGGTKIYDRKNQQIYRLQIGDQHIIAKTYRISSFARILAALLGFSRARRSFRASVLLRQAGIPTPKSLFLIEEGSPFYSASTLVTNFCEGPSLRKFLTDTNPIPPTLADDIKNILIGLKSTKIRHGDFHDRNLLISPDGRPNLIDLDSARKRFSKKTVAHNIQEDRDRLLHSIDYDPDFQATLIEKLGAPGTPLLAP